MLPQRLDERVRVVACRGLEPHHNKAWKGQGKAPMSMIHSANYAETKERLTATAGC